MWCKHCALCGKVKCFRMQVTFQQWTASWLTIFPHCKLHLILSRYLILISHLFYWLSICVFSSFQLLASPMTLLQVNEAALNCAPLLSLLLRLMDRYSHSHALMVASGPGIKTIDFPIPFLFVYICNLLNRWRKDICLGTGTSVERSSDAYPPLKRRVQIHFTESCRPRSF
jgi:hypothetical protein